MSKKSIILKAIAGSDEPLDLGAIFEMVVEETDQTEDQLYAYLAFLKGKQDGSITCNAEGGYSLTEKGRGYLLGKGIYYGPEPEPEPEDSEEPEDPPAGDGDRDTLPEILVMDRVSRALDHWDKLRVLEKARVRAWIVSKYF